MDALKYINKKKYIIFNGKIKKVKIKKIENKTKEMYITYELLERKYIKTPEQEMKQKLLNKKECIEFYIENEIKIKTSKKSYMFSLPYYGSLFSLEKELSYTFFNSSVEALYQLHLEDGFDKIRNDKFKNSECLLLLLKIYEENKLYKKKIKAMNLEERRKLLKHNMKNKSKKIINL